MSNNIWIRVRVLLVIISVFILSGALYFLTAGRLDLPFPWIYYSIHLINAIIIYTFMDMDLLHERLKKKPDAEKWDVVFNRIYSLTGLLVPVMAGLDLGVLKATPEIPAVIKIISIFVLIPGAIFADWALFTNRYFSRFVRIQHDRNQKVVDKGPYGIIRHPAYAVALLSLILVPVILNSFLAYIPSGICFIFMVWRTIKEDATLVKKLEGYEQYSNRVKYRLIPGIF